MKGVKIFFICAFFTGIFFSDSLYSQRDKVGYIAFVFKKVPKNTRRTRTYVPLLNIKLRTNKKPLLEFSKVMRFSEEVRRCYLFRFPIGTQQLTLATSLDLSSFSYTGGKENAKKHSGRYLKSENAYKFEFINIESVDGEEIEEFMTFTVKGPREKKIEKNIYVRVDKVKICTLNYNHFLIHRGAKVSDVGMGYQADFVLGGVKWTVDTKDMDEFEEWVEDNNIIVDNMD